MVGEGVSAKCSILYAAPKNTVKIFPVFSNNIPKLCSSRLPGIFAGLFLDNAAAYLIERSLNQSPRRK